MKLLFLGNFEFWMCRRAEILHQGLKANKMAVDTVIGKKIFISRAVKLLSKKNYDVVLASGIVPLLVGWLLKPLHRKKIIYDVFISRYNTEVEDRKRVKKNSVKAKILFLLDKLSCKLVNVKFLDTKAHVKYFKKTFGSKNIKVVYVGASDKLWKKKKIDIIKNNKFNVVFWGAFSPLHGTKTIVRTVISASRHTTTSVKTDISESGHANTIAKTVISASGHAKTIVKLSLMPRGMPKPGLCMSLRMIFENHPEPQTSYHDSPN